MTRIAVPFLPADDGESPVLTLARRFVGVQIAGLLVPLAAGLMVFGWRALLACGLVLLGGAVGHLVWSRVGRRGRMLDGPHSLWLCLVLAALLPAHLAAGATPDVAGPHGAMLWPLLPAAGLALMAINWLLGGVGGGRVLPPLIVLLALASLYGPALQPRLSLVRTHAVTGDLMDYTWNPLADLRDEAWLLRDIDPAAPDATWRTPATSVLTAYAAGSARRTLETISIGSVVRDRLPPLEDVIVLGHPAPIGSGSLVAILAGAMFLFYRGVGDFKIALLAFGSAYFALGLLPVPASIGPDGIVWTLGPMFGGGLLGRGEVVGWDLGLTYVHYELLAGPMPFLFLFLAPLPSLRPLSSGWRVPFALLLGPAAAIAGRYGDAALGPLAALAAVSLLTPVFDRLTRARPMV